MDSDKDKEETDGDLVGKEQGDVEVNEEESYVGSKNASNEGDEVLQADDKHKQEDQQAVDSNRQLETDVDDEQDTFRIALAVGSYLEVFDGRDWYISTIKKMDNENQRIYIGYFGWHSKFDEWISIESDRIRKIKNTSLDDLVAKIAKLEFPQKLLNTIIAIATNNTKYGLRLDHNNLRDAGTMAIGEGLGKNTKLQRLYLINNSIGDVGAAAIGEGLGNNATLLTLDLLKNNIGDLGAMAIGEGLGKNTKLRELTLADNNIGDVGGTAIGEGLGKNTTLQELSLHTNDIGDVGAKAIGEGLGKNSKLQELNLEGNEIGDVGATAIGEGLRKNTKLRYLSLIANNFAFVGLLALAKGFRFNEDMTHLSTRQAGVFYVNATATAEIGRGYFGSVHLATLESGREAVLKRSHSKNSREEVYERMILQRLPEHQNVVKLAGLISCIMKNDSTLLLEVHKGGSLCDFVKKNKDDVTLSKFFLYSLGMCKAIQHLHKHGLLHRDIALRNYVLTEDLQTPVLVDFGLSWPIGEEKEVQIRPTELLPFRQCPPEVLTTLRYSKASDIWQLGLALWELIHRGRQPFFQFENSHQLSKFLTKKMVQEKATIPLPFSKKVSLAVIKRVKELVVFCCTYEPSERPSAAELVQQVQSLQESYVAPLEEEKESPVYKPDEETVNDGLRAYNFTDYELLETEGQRDYRNLKSDMEMRYDELRKVDEFPDVDL